jgi:hypothetical protein
MQPQSLKRGSPHSARMQLNENGPQVNRCAEALGCYDRPVMIRFLLRFFGLVFLAAAFVLVIYDGTKSIAANKLFLTSVSTIWEILNPASLAKVRPAIEAYAGGYLWDPLMVTILAAPGWSVLGVLGIAFLLLGRRKKPLIGYARP